MTAAMRIPAKWRVGPLVLSLGVATPCMVPAPPASAQQPEPLAYAAGLTGKVLGAGGPLFLGLALEPAQTIAGLRPSLEAWVGDEVHPVLAIVYPLLSVDDSAIGLHIGAMAIRMRRGVHFGPRFGLDLRVDPAIAIRGELDILGDEGWTLSGLGIRLAL
jgi:hypothetical protein